MAFTKKTVRDADVEGKRALKRVDFIVPLKDRVDTDDTRVRPEIAKTLASYGDLFVLDAVGAAHRAQGSTGEVVDSDKIPDDRMGMDIGPKTRELYAEAIKGAKTVFWNGPMGVFEFDNFAHGTQAVAEAVAELKDNGGTSIIGGGDSVAAVNKFDLADKMSWISTGGGASMELVEGKALPGVEALNDAE